jgi:hypothetical protein
MSNPAPPYQPKANSTTLGQAVKGLTRNHVIPNELLPQGGRPSLLIKEFLKLPDGGTSIFDFDALKDNGQYLSRTNNDLSSIGDPAEILNGGTKDIGFHKAYSDTVAARLKSFETDPSSPYRPLIDGLENGLPITEVRANELRAQFGGELKQISNEARFLTSNEFTGTTANAVRRQNIWH